MDEGFPTGLGVESEAVLVEALAMYHMGRSDAECVAHQAFVNEAPDRTYGDAYTLTADELNEAAAVCEIDFSTLWYTHD